MQASLQSTWPIPLKLGTCTTSLQGSKLTFSFGSQLAMGKIWSPTYFICNSHKNANIGFCMLLCMQEKSNGEPKLLKTTQKRLNCYKATVFLNTHVIYMSLVRRWWFLLSYFEWKKLSKTTWFLGFQGETNMGLFVFSLLYFFKTWFFNFVTFHHWQTTQCLTYM